MKVLEFWYVPAAHAVQEIPFFLYPDLHDAHMLAPLLVHDAPVAAFPLSHVQTFLLHTHFSLVLHGN